MMEGRHGEDFRPHERSRVVEEMLERIWRRVEENHRMLRRLEKRMATDEARLDEGLAALGAKLADLTGGLTGLEEAVRALIAAIPVGANLTDEIATVETALGVADTALGEVKTIGDEVAAATPPAPTEGG